MAFKRTKSLQNGIPNTFKLFSQYTRKVKPHDSTCFGMAGEQQQISLTDFRLISIESLLVYL